MTAGPIWAVALMIAVSGSPAAAEILRWASALESASLDPHAQTEAAPATLIRQIYEPLVLRNPEGALEPALATDWQVSASDPTVWVFNLRQGVTFHDGAKFDSADVVYSIGRARSEGSGLRTSAADIRAVRAPGPFTVEIVTTAPTPNLPDLLTGLEIMDKGWTEANRAGPVAADGYAASHTNGTGPYRLVAREAGVRTDLTVHEAYWGHVLFAMDVTGIVHTPLPEAALLPALRDGLVDVVQDVPARSLTKADHDAGLSMQTAPQNRVIFFGLNVGAKDLVSDDLTTGNPLSDPRVRRAMSMTINRDVIQQVVMGGQSRPAGMLIAPSVTGWSADLNRPPETDVLSAKALMAEAGYDDGFTLRLDCPEGRYAGDAAICEAVARMMAQIDIIVTPEITSSAVHFGKILAGETDFYLLGLGVSTLDSAPVLDALYHSRKAGHGVWNATGFADPAFDQKIDALAAVTDPGERAAQIADLWVAAQDLTLYLPLHQQVTSWGVGPGVEMTVDPADTPLFKYVTLQ
ncbi:ABC transporter substrate-binding protein [Pseudoruegeria sp. SK021]|uniref:ABC transporter substrate-binding protein n=1 Tax=Pseudoruegeria sp. SK021 TaxID=1933035 RepID=UPI000A23986E|nr:ABC transporter substrate-binding protein [Pseudoruegeria sp. SK021]OSP56604.1 hypothetical protein BV911_01195 [Pseudoruegeria sp. SK021]